MIKNTITEVAEITVDHSLILVSYTATFWLLENRVDVIVDSVKTDRNGVYEENSYFFTKYYREVKNQAKVDATEKFLEKLRKELIGA